MNTKEECQQRFLEQMASITLDDQLAFFARRRSLALSGESSLLIPAMPGVVPRYPFSSSDYPYYDISSKALQQLATCRPETLFDGSLSTLSDLRSKPSDYEGLPPEASKYKFQVWDSAMGIPACAIRRAGERHPSKIKPFRNCNTRWFQALLPAMLHVGPIGKNKSQVRPEGRFIFDLSKLEPHLAHLLLEIAHVIAHRRGDYHREARSYAVGVGRTAGHLRGIMAEIVIALLFDLPIDVSARNFKRPAEPDLPYGLEVKTTTHFHSPVMRIPCIKPETTRFDETLGIALVSVYIEPVPYGYIRHSGETTNLDCWSCMPTIFALCGWEGVDVITHSDVGRYEDSPVSWYMRAEDLLEPETLWNYFFDMSQTTRPDGKPLFPYPWEIANVQGGRWWYIMDWIHTPEYQVLLAQTPPFPCKMCMSFNPDAKGSPKIPRKHRPDDMPRNRMTKEWRDYFNAVDEIHDIIEPDMVKYEVNLYGGSRVRVREARAKAHQEKLERIAYRYKMEDVRARNDIKEVSEGMQAKLKAYDAMCKAQQ